ncbi:hypothetical protein OIE67_25710 [Nonomuraea fuscirosea]|uniref:hypothetical protein n=1 Tax=Nonomuraea fuscirosea TaxID=1291556 RepID=UPI002DDB1B53|nr:hypothetical protein [Nonomuraea fuscirosea]WSA57893.1 hypothetical protein OIE67_25710 [Nonomuraea fuscirosea]
MDGWTVEDAATLLYPALTASELRTVIDLFGIAPVGARRTGRRGRPLPTYDPSTLQEAHAIVVRARVDLGGFRAA